jgi:retron-type reverse transcriptase
MKLLEQILSNRNLKEAYERVRRNKGAGGVGPMTTEELGSYLNKNQSVIKDAIRKRTYKPKPVKRVEIPKENGKTRKLGILCVVDRVIQQAIHQ